MTETAVPTWEIARESAEWVGPIDVTLTTVDGDVLPQDGVTFAVLPIGTRPDPDFSDFAAPYLDPQGSGAFGVWAPQMASRQTQGIWARDENNPETPVLEPKQVGWIVRT